MNSVNSLLYLGIDLLICLNMVILKGRNVLSEEKRINVC